MIILPNLLVDLYRLAYRQGENFTTEAFVHLLKHLVVHQPPAAERLLGLLTGDRFKLSNFNVQKVQISTQEITEHGRPDIRISASSDYLGYIEVKLGASLGQSQLSSYHKDLQSSGVGRTSLTLLTRYPCEIPREEEPNVAIRWFQIAQLLEQEIRLGDLDPVTAYLVEQFLGFLEALNITIHQVHSGIAVGVQSYLSNHDAFAPARSRFRTPEKLLEFPELLPLYQLMVILGEVVAGLKDKQGKSFRIKFDTGKHGSGWIGYNLNNMDYFVELRFSQPETLVFQAYHQPFDVNRWDKKIGRYRGDKKTKSWENELDLNAPTINFFELGKAQQLEVLQKFVQFSLDEARKCYPTGFKDAHDPA